MHICRNNQYPARGRKLVDREAGVGVCDETINTPLGDGNDLNPYAKGGGF